MKTVWKFPLRIDDRQTVMMPVDAQILHVDWQEGTEACVWALVDDESPAREKRWFRISGTGHPLPDFAPWWRFVGTFLMRPLGLVFHVWDLRASGDPLLSGEAPR